MVHMKVDFPSLSTEFSRYWSNTSLAFAGPGKSNHLKFSLLTTQCRFESITYPAVLQSSLKSNLFSLERDITIFSLCGTGTNGCKVNFYSWMSFHNSCSCSWSVPESEHFQCGSSDWSSLKLAFHRWCTWSLVSHPQTMISLGTGQTLLLHQKALK